MDKLQSLNYFVAAADAKSFSGAARRLGVSVAAVAKRVALLERSLGAPLFERHARGLALTTNGASYLETCRPALEQIEAAAELFAVSSRRPRGTVVVGTQPAIAQLCLADALPRFNALFPDIQLDVRCVMQTTDIQARGVDVFLMLGWPEASELVQRSVGAAGLVICASPSYWAIHGVPQHPQELQRHNCLVIRNNSGTLMDLWRFERGDESVAVAARGWLVADNENRDMVRDLTLAGGGVARMLDWHRRAGNALENGSLVAVLTDWKVAEVPPVTLLYPPRVRRMPRVRTFIDFVTQLFRDIEQERNGVASATAAPGWLRSNKPRASSSIGSDS